MWRLVWIWHVSKFYLPLQIQSTFYWHLPWDFGRAEMMIVMIGWKKNHFFSVLSHSSSRTYTTNIGKIHFASLKNCGKWSMAIYHIYKKKLHNYVILLLRWLQTLFIQLPFNGLDMSTLGYDGSSSHCSVHWWYHTFDVLLLWAKPQDRKEDGEVRKKSSSRSPSNGHTQF